jgi:hypothetical protein
LSGRGVSTFRRVEEREGEGEEREGGRFLKKARGRVGGRGVDADGEERAAFRKRGCAI